MDKEMKMMFTAVLEEIARVEEKFENKFDKFDKFGISNGIIIS